MCEDAKAMLSGRFRDFYIQHAGIVGAKPSGNIPCPNDGEHLGGKDVHPSCSVDNYTGAYKCHTCGTRGHLESFFYKFVATKYPNMKIYDFIETHVGISKSMYTDPETYKADGAIAAILSKKKKEFEDYAKFSGNASDTPIPNGEEIVKDACERLMNYELGLSYWKENRHATPQHLSRLGIGITEDLKCFTIPLLDGTGKVMNIKHYNPVAVNKAEKWVYPYAGYKTMYPIPMESFSCDRIIITEGEPDMITAYSHNIGGIGTFGSCSNVDIDKIFGEYEADQIFSGKSIVIAFDPDKAGREGALKLAGNLYKYAKQIKIIDFDKSEINPNGLDPENVEKIAGTKKTKRVESDLTDWFKKQGFGERATKAFEELIELTDVYSENEDRASDMTYKVSLVEANKSTYFTSDGTKTLEIIAQVTSMDPTSYNIPDSVTFTCPKLEDDDYNNAKCKECSMLKRSEFTDPDASSLIINFTVGFGKSTIERTVIKPGEIMGLIGQRQRAYMDNIKMIMDIPQHCTRCSFVENDIRRITIMSVSNDTTGYKDTAPSEKSESEVTSFTDCSMDVVYVHNDDSPDIKENKSYVITGNIVKSWDFGHNVIFTNNVRALETSTEKFKMNAQYDEMLSDIFSPEEWTVNAIKEKLDHKYAILSGDAGIVSRDDLFFLSDLAFHSQLVIDNPVVAPGVSRGWVEIFILGDSRCGKSQATRWMHKHYQVGEIAGGSSAMTRSGLLGGMGKASNGKSVVVWGKLPKNHGSIITLDEASKIHPEVMSDMTEMRSGGEVAVDTIKSGKTLARVRKIFISNARDDSDHGTNSDVGLIPFARDLFVSDRVITRFDIGILIRQGDVDAPKSVYRPIGTEYTSYQCRTLIKWAWSRSVSDVVYEEGYREEVDKWVTWLTGKYVSETLMVNIEMMSKLIRLPLSLAGMLYSTTEDCNKIYVRKVFVEYMALYIDKLYSSPNMKLDEFSKMKIEESSVGNIEFLKSILNPQLLKMLMNTNDFSEKDIIRMFSTYLLEVQSSEKYMYDPFSCKYKTAIRMADSGGLLFNTLLLARCFQPLRRKYIKTKAFSEWLRTYYKEVGDSFEPNNKLDAGVVKASQPDRKSDKTAEEIARAASSLE